MLAVVTLIPLLLSLLTNVGDLTAPTIVALVFAAVVETVDALVWGKVRQAGEDGLPTFYTAVSGFRMLLCAVFLPLQDTIIAAAKTATYIRFLFIPFIDLFVNCFPLSYPFQCNGRNVVGY